MEVQELKNNANGVHKPIFTNVTSTVIHAFNEAKKINALPVKYAFSAFKSLAEEEQVLVFARIGYYLQKKIIQRLTKKEVNFILNKLSSTDRYSFFYYLPALDRVKYLEYLDENNKKATQSMLGYPKNSVARLVNTDFCTIKAEMTIEEANAFLRKNQKDTEAADIIYVIDQEGKLLDDIPIRRLILNDPSKHIRDIMDGYTLKLNIKESIDEATTKFKEFDVTVLPVTDTNNLLLGVVNIDDVIDAAERRNTREMQKFGGVESLEYPYVNTGLFSLIRKRAGWLVLLFLSEMLTATAMGYFEKEIAAAVVLALFVPLVISSGGNSGSQAATLIIRAMAVKELSVKDWWYVMRRELLSGFSLGAILGSLGFLRITIWQKLHWYDYGPHWALMALTIFFSLIGIVMWGTISGSMIPIILKRIKLDPATSSAPFVATLVDVTGLIIYFSIAAIVLKGTLL